MVMHATRQRHLSPAGGRLAWAPSEAAYGMSKLLASLGQAMLCDVPEPEREPANRNPV
jgi:hypothetical protein